MKKCIFYFLFIFSISGQSLEQAKPWIGISIETKPDGVIVQKAIQGTPAEKAGLQSGDLIKKIDSTPLKTAKELISYIQSKGVGNEVLVEFLRGGKLKRLPIKLEARPDEFALIQKQLMGKSVPDFKLENMGKKEIISGKDIENKITLLEFWATWCGPCRVSHKRLSIFSEQNPSIKVLAISNEKTDLIQKYVNSTKPKFTTVRDSTGELFNFFLVSAIPMTVLLDRKGKVQDIALGGGFYLEEILTKAIELEKK